MYFRWNNRRVCMWILLFLQVFLIATFIYIQKNKLEKSTTRPQDKVSFLSSLTNVMNVNNISYLTLNDKVHLKRTSTSSRYVNFNTSMCFINGTDLKVMQRSNDVNWSCECINGWHGIDCGQPEVIWRAFLTSRKSINIRGPRKYHRRVIYVCEVDKYSKLLTEIRVNELQHVVDLFVLFETKNSQYLKEAMNNGFLKEFHHTILYANNDHAKKLWWLKQNVIKNLENDDIIFISNSSDIPNKLVIDFLRIYDNWQEPINFRLRWSVYGFFWTHPWKTTLKGGACTYAYLKKYLNSDILALVNNKTFLSGKGLTVGDLNHFGGWLCEFCIEEPAIIVDLLYKNVSNQPIRIQTEKIDTSYIEDLIENGIYLDGKTELVRSRRYQESYYAPRFVEENNWKYDFLYTNLYSKLDYY